MSNIITTEKELKQMVKENLAEILKNRKDLLEIIEDVAFGKIIEEGDKSNFVSEDVILKSLKE
ncbi:MAG: hypothetical protein WBK20_03025 [Spirochaetota bacterium]